MKLYGVMPNSDRIGGAGDLIEFDTDDIVVMTVRVADDPRGTRDRSVCVVGATRQEARAAWALYCARQAAHTRTVLAAWDDPSLGDKT